jgi:S1-C subfamily serine protease
MSDKLLYIRVRGKVQGPFTVDALRAMRDRGQFRRFHEVSEDRRSWAPATALNELFPSESVAKAVAEDTTFEQVTEAPSSPEGNNDAQRAKVSSRNEWYYVDETGGQRGPVSKAELQDLWRRGDLDDTSYVWNSRMNSWQAINSLPEFGSRGGRGSRSGKSLPVNRLALLSFILGILWLGGLGSVAAMILGYHALRRLQRNKEREGGRRMALIGIFAGAGTLVAVTPFAGYFLYQYFGIWAHVQRLGGSATPEEITAAFKHRVYLVQAGDNVGSGIMIASYHNRGLVVTNRHVLIPGFDAGKANPAGRPLILQEVKIKNPDEITPKPCRVAACHQRLDLALLITENASEKANSIAIVRQKGLRQGESAVALGSPLGLEYFTSPGVISSTRGELGLIWTTCPINKGNSGGPLFLARHGLLAAITTIDLNPLGAQNLGGCIPAEEIVDSLQRRLTDAWEWRHEYKDITLQLADLIPLED